MDARVSPALIWGEMDARDRTSLTPREPDLRQPKDEPASSVGRVNHAAAVDGARMTCKARWRSGTPADAV